MKEVGCDQTFRKVETLCRPEKYRAGEWLAVYIHGIQSRIRSLKVDPMVIKLLTHLPKLNLVPNIEYCKMICYTSIVSSRT